MRPFGRQPIRVVRAFIRPNTYQAFRRMLKVYARPFDALTRYLFGRGAYPWAASIRTPIGRVSVILFHPQDMLTLNEIFCRQDYGSGGQRVVVDLGANIGLATLYFLTRQPETFVYAVEPVPRNVERLRTNLAPFEARYMLYEKAVSTSSGPAPFVVEETGRLGGLQSHSTRQGNVITVECLPVSQLIQEVVDREGHIDLLKIDTEGNEVDLIHAIPESLRPHISTIVWENNDGTVRTT